MPPKPGVIPLRPLGLGDILGGAFSTMGRYWKQLFGVGAAVYGGALVVVGAAVAIAYSAVSDPLHRVMELSSEESPRSEDIVPLAIALGAVWLVAVLVLMTATAMMYATVPAVLQDAVLGRPTTFGIIWRRAWARVPAVIGTVLLTSLVAVIPIVLMMVAFIAMTIAFITLDGSGSGVAIAVGVLGALATAPLAIWLWVKFSLAPAAAVFEGQRPVAALRRSSQLVRGDWWRIFGISLLAILMAAVASYIIQLPFSILGMFPGVIGMESLGSDPNATAVVVAMSGYLVATLLGQLVSQLVSATFPQLVTGLLYVDRRMRNENLGPVLAEAAAVPPQFGP
ncbi:MULTISPECIES: hypothetical protein [unclassified Streptomyces]|uniref:DUF7847 domain-containing protein n=1 Tax=unclassified Streptomyces TaxID=2593676 RepID=UPI000B8A2AD6|nr:MULTISPECIES: hypothetical protein [unclassified Streptomyces]MDX2729265.1 hypothetical protein [Streptomyces sp. PA03-2a]MDX3768172.1 hypothetical protein [Streptomyces sp. AK08-01B]MDX3817562.1 hypothetical protein [Streptomyces sp. AK08-01A]WSQ30212.1 hypothetical protein OG763_32875 [Streptomyces sp. NBC_01230]